MNNRFAAVSVKLGDRSVVWWVSGLVVRRRLLDCCDDSQL